MHLAAVLVLNFHLHVEEIRSLTKQKGILQMAPHTRVHVLLSETKTGANRSVNVCFMTVKILSLRHWSSRENEDDRLFLFSRDHSGGRIHEMVRERLSLTHERSVIAPHCFGNGPAIRDFMLRRLSKNALKDRGRWKENTTLYPDVQSARSLIVPVTVQPSG